MIKFFSVKIEKRLEPLAIFPQNKSIIDMPMGSKYVFVFFTSSGPSHRSLSEERDNNLICIKEKKQHVV